MVGRFQVMAILQAARAKVLGYPTDLAKSFGLNRAIFYAAAKRGFKKGITTHAGEKKTYRISHSDERTETVKEDVIGNEKAFYIDVSGKKWFVMGDEILTPDKFRRQVELRFANNFDRAWYEALAIVGQTDHETLESQRKFFEQVYKPRRDELAKEWSEMAG